MLKTPKVLFAGNSKKTLQLGREALSSPVDCQVVPAPAMSVALFLAQKNLPELIVSSFDMQDGDGLSFLQEIMIDEETRRIPFIFLVDEMVDEITEIKALKAGARKVLPNDMTSAEFLELVRPLIAEGSRNKVERFDVADE